MKYIREKDLYLYYPDYMYHHGVKGMKWGKRKKYKPHPRKKKGNQEESKKLKLTDKQKKYVKIGVAAVATGLAVYGGYKLYQHSIGIQTPKMAQMKRNLGKKNLEFLRQMDNGKEVSDKVLGGDIDKPFKTFDKNKPIKDLIKGVNPTKSNTNCRACAASTALRMMGIDAEALNIPGGRFSEVVNGCFKNANIIEMYEPSKEKIIRNMTRRFKDGDLGMISATIRNYRGDENAHAFNWKIEKGIPKFFDGQQELADCSFYLDAIVSSKAVEFTKTNGLELNFESLINFIKFRK